MSRPQIRVAAGVLVDARGRFLAAQRPAGKIAAGKWEFPGGKIEAGESPEQALVRELQEELGVNVTQSRPLIRIQHAYSDRDVSMWVYLVQQWNGEIQAHDGQAFCWGQVSELRQLDLLGADGPILRALELPSQLPITPPNSDVPMLLELASRWMRSGLLVARLRLPACSDKQYHEIAAQLINETPVAWVLDRCPQTTEKLGAAGFHANSAFLAQMDQRPLPERFFCGASCHDLQTWERARNLGCDYALLSPVCPTATHPQQDVLGWGSFRAIVERGGLPTYALGGMQSTDLERARAAWGQGISGIRLFS